MINEEILKKFNVGSIEDYEGLAGEDMAELVQLKTFQAQTNHINGEIFERFIDVMTDNVNIGTLIKFFKNAKEEYGDVLDARKEAKKRIKELLREE